MRIVMGIFFAFLMAQSSIANAVTIDNSPTGNSINPFGFSGSATYGQVFTAPISGTLDSFTLSLNSGITGQLWGGVGTWNGSSTFGLGFGSPLNLYQSSNVDASAGGAFTFAPGVFVTAGQQYVAYISVFGNIGSNATSMPLALSTQNINYFVWNNSTDPRNNSSWNYFSNFGTALFAASFSNEGSVPEPATISLLALGFAGMAVRRRKSR